MGYLDKAKSLAEQGMVKATEAGKAGHSKIEDIQAKRKADGLLHDLGALTYADHSGRSSLSATNQREQIISELQRYESEHGPLVP